MAHFEDLPDFLCNDLIYLYCVHNIFLNEHCSKPFYKTSIPTQCAASLAELVKTAPFYNAKHASTSPKPSKPLNIIWDRLSPHLVARVTSPGSHNLFLYSSRSLSHPSSPSYVNVRQWEPPLLYIILNYIFDLSDMKTIGVCLLR